ncbi:MAG: hypothetical protein MK193_15480 [Lentisphaeria bacterium]|nr:hypothetical protein [Lentisphaeria bacterium]
MQLKSVKSLLKHWNTISKSRESLVNVTIPIAHQDWVRIQAFASAYHLKTEDVIQDILHESLDQLEASIPYVPGPNVIRVEEGDPVYEDIGLMPKYLRLKNELLQL